MRIAKIQIFNMRGLELEQDLPAVGLIQGGNGAGKSSFLECLAYPFRKGHDETMITVGKDAGEIIATMDDGTQFRAVAKRGEGTTRYDKKPGSKRWSVSRAEIDALVNAASYDPLEFLNLKPADQLQLLLKIMPITVTEDDLIAAVADIGEKEPLYRNGKLQAFIIPDGLDGLAKISKLRQAVYDERTTQNTGAAAKLDHAKELKATIDEAAPEGTDWSVVSAEKEAAKKAVEEKLNIAVSDSRAKLDKAKELAQQAYQKSIDDALKADQKRQQEAMAEFGPALNSCAKELAQAQERARRAAAQDATRKAVAIAEQSALAMKQHADTLTQALRRLDELKRKTAANLAIPGIKIEDGIIYDEKGVPFSTWNEQAKIIFCLRLAVLAHGKAGFVLVDSQAVGALEPKYQKAVMEAAHTYAERDGMQFFFATVTAEEPLNVVEAK